ncbi:MAG: hypothetical protein PHD88_05600 [Firmicutes bacterium]|nr:hypothetical protein [Bacillota bacterium]MDD4693853.1 hypothetical protein [Bacillota bacterium]
MFINYLNDEQKQFLLALSNELLALKAKVDPKDRTYQMMLEENMRGTINNSATTKRPETIFLSRKDRFIALFELYKLAYITEKLSIEEESYLSFLGWRFRFERSEILSLIDLAKQARSLEDDAQVIIVGSV